MTCECREITVRLHHPRKDGVQTAGVDECIAPLAQALNDAGWQTRASCCGHGKLPGSIVLEDWREIRICNYDQARTLDRIMTEQTNERPEIPTPRL